MHFVVLSSLASVALATQPKLLFGRQDYSVYPGESVTCAPEFVCAEIYCLRSDEFCCEDGSHPCGNGDYCLGTNSCCYGDEDISACAARNNIAIPDSFASPAPALSSSTPVISASNPILSTTLPTFSVSLPTLSTSVPTVTPSYPVGNATLPAPTGTGTPSTSVLPFTGGSERLGHTGEWVLGLVGAVVGLII